MELTLKSLEANWKRLSVKKTLSGNDALEAVKQDGYALQYVKEQTEAVCLEAVKQDVAALRYVEEQIFAMEITGSPIDIKINN